MRRTRPNGRPSGARTQGSAAAAGRFPVQVRATFIRLPRRTAAAAA
jgi:hypothetical protein